MVRFPTLPEAVTAFFKAYGAVQLHGPGGSCVLCSRDDECPFRAEAGEAHAVAYAALCRILAQEEGEMTPIWTAAWNYVTLTERGEDAAAALERLRRTHAESKIR